MGFCSFMLSEWVSERVRVDRSMNGPGLLGVRVIDCGWGWDVKSSLNMHKTVY